MLLVFDYAAYLMLQHIDSNFWILYRLQAILSATSPRLASTIPSPTGASAQNQQEKYGALGTSIGQKRTDASEEGEM
eukprot:201292-Rhodomonas_salina.1